MGFKESEQAVDYVFLQRYQKTLNFESRTRYFGRNYA